MANAWLLKPLPLAGVTVTAGSTSLGSPAYLGNDYAGVVWASDSGTLTRVVVDLGADTPVDTLFLFGVYSGDPAAMLQVQVATAAQGSGFTAGTFYNDNPQNLFAGSNRLVSGAGVALWSAPSDGRPAIRYIRLVLTRTVGSTVQVARLAAGARVTFSRNFSYGGGQGARDLGSLDFSPRAVMLRRRGGRQRTVNLTFSNIHRDVVEASLLPLFELAGNTEPLALALDPTPDAMLERRCYFGQLTGDLGAVWRNAAAWESKLPMVSLF